jgi:hypothetical protein
VENVKDKPGAAFRKERRSYAMLFSILAPGDGQGCGHKCEGCPGALAFDHDVLVAFQDLDSLV